MTLAWGALAVAVIGSIAVAVVGDLLLLAAAWREGRAAPWAWIALGLGVVASLAGPAAPFGGLLVVVLAARIGARAEDRATRLVARAAALTGACGVVGGAASLALILIFSRP